MTSSKNRPSRNPGIPFLLFSGSGGQRGFVSVAWLPFLYPVKGDGDLRFLWQVRHLDKSIAPHFRHDRSLPLPAAFLAISRIDVFPSSLAITCHCSPCKNQILRGPVQLQDYTSASRPSQDLLSHGIPFVKSGRHLQDDISERPPTGLRTLPMSRHRRRSKTAFPEAEQVYKRAGRQRAGPDLHMNDARIFDEEQSLRCVHRRSEVPSMIESPRPLALHDCLEDFIHLAVAELPLKHP